MCGSLELINIAATLFSVVSLDEKLGLVAICIIVIVLGASVILSRIAE